MIEILREWHHTWNPYVDGLVSIILFLGDYVFLMIAAAVIGNKLERKNDEKKLLLSQSVKKAHEGKKDKHEKTSRCNRDRRINDK